MPETSARSKNYRNPLQAFWRLFRDERPDWLRSRPKDLDATPWPDGASLPRARVVAHNTRLIPASPEAIFEQLRRPTGWPSFYANAVDCTVQGSAGTLQAGTRFTWTTFGVQQRSQVLEYEEGCRITWDARSPGTYAIHRWLLHPEAGGTRVVTEEIQPGWVPSLLGPLLARALHAGHGMWLAGLAAVTAAPANASPPAADRPLARPVADMKPHYGVVVVGSGYGGGIAASRLARAGRDVCLLERGREIRPGEYPATAMHAEREIQIHSKDGHVGSELGLFDFHASEGLSALVGCGLGGTSLINANVALRAVPGVWQDPRWPREVRDDSAGLEAGYRHAEEMLRPTPYPEEAPALAKLDALKASAAALGRADRFYRPPLNVTFDDRLSPAGVSQSACNGCGDCVSGCNHRAKNTTLMNYLPDAANHGADLFTQCAVDRVEPGPGGKE